ncbi:MAG: hypothetical protein WAU15_07740, partial [Nitrosomonas sp.]
MRLPRGQHYVDDIRKLVSLKFKDRKAYEALKKTIMKEYSVSQRTVYRDMKDRIPGLRKVRKDSGKLKSKMPAKAKRIMSEALEAGLTKSKAVKIAEKLTGKKVSIRVVTRTK